MNADELLDELCGIYSVTEINECRKYFIKYFLIHYSEFYALIQNMNASVEVDVACSQKVLEITEHPESYSCSLVESVSNSLHNRRWSREMVNRERHVSHVQERCQVYAQRILNQ